MIHQTCQLQELATCLRQTHFRFRSLNSRDCDAPFAAVANDSTFKHTLWLLDRHSLQQTTSWSTQKYSSCLLKCTEVDTIIILVHFFYFCLFTEKQQYAKVRWYIRPVNYQSSRRAYVKPSGWISICCYHEGLKTTDRK
jgi:hypothetical protein